jgi:putative YhbY family RNA-binding protein
MVNPSKNKVKRCKTSSGKPAILIGKKGSTDAIMKEISKYLDVNKSVKIKILKTALLNEETSEIAQKTAKATGSIIAQVCGHTFTLYKPKKLIPKKTLKKNK